jgi:hypothetical protein
LALLLRAAEQAAVERDRRRREVGSSVSANFDGDHGETKKCSHSPLRVRKSL